MKWLSSSEGVRDRSFAEGWVVCWTIKIGIDKWIVIGTEEGNDRNSWQSFPEMRDEPVAFQPGCTVPYHDDPNYRIENPHTSRFGGAESGDYTIPVAL
jgi:hypothetical protein